MNQDHTPEAETEAAAIASPGAVTDATMQALLGTTAPGIAFLLRRGPAFDAGPAGMALQWEHARNMFTRLRDGTLTHVSALVDGSDVLGFGLLRAGSKAEAEALLAADPAVAAGRLVPEVLTALSFGPEALRDRP